LGCSPLSVVVGRGGHNVGKYRCWCVLIVVEMEPGVVGLENEKTLLIYAKWRSLN
jgi:hypothetical protein